MRLAALVFGLALAAQSEPLAWGQTSPLTLYVDTGAAYSRSDSETKLAAQYTGRNAALSARQAQLQASITKLNRDLPALSEAERIPRQRMIRDEQEKIQSDARALQQDLAQARGEAQSAFAEKMEQALKDYLAQNTSVALVEYYDSTESDVVVRSLTYDISVNLFEMTKSGPGAFANAAPKTAAKVMYVDFAVFFNNSGFSEKYRIARETMAHDYMNKRSALSAQIDKVASNRALPTDSADAQVKALYDQWKKLDDQSKMELTELRDFHLATAHEALVNFLKTDVSAAGADVIQIYDHSYGKFGGVRVANKALDITAAVTAAYKAKNKT